MSKKFGISSVFPILLTYSFTTAFTRRETQLISSSPWITSRKFITLRDNKNEQDILRKETILVDAPIDISGTEEIETNERYTNPVVFVDHNINSISKLPEIKYSSVVDVKRIIVFLFRAALIGSLTGMGVSIFKSSIFYTSDFFFGVVADVLPKPAFYWPLAIYPILGSTGVALLSYLNGPSIRNGIDSIARSIDTPSSSNNPPSSFSLRLTGQTESSQLLEVDNTTVGTADMMAVTTVDRMGDDSVLTIRRLSQRTALRNAQDTGGAPAITSEGLVVRAATGPATSLMQSDVEKSNSTSTSGKASASFDPLNQFVRLAASTLTLGSGCSLGPEGPSVELGAGLSRMLCGAGASCKEKHHLFLAGTAAGVAAGFSAPISGVFFAIEVGNRYLAKNTVQLDEDAPDGPRIDIAAIVLAATLANIFVSFREVSAVKPEALSIMGNNYAMSSPLFEMPTYLGLGLVCGLISVGFTKLRDWFVYLYTPSTRDSEADGRTSDELSVEAGKWWLVQSQHLKRLFSSVPVFLRPILGGLFCGIVAVFYPQTLFAGYSTLDELLLGRYHFELPLLALLLGLKLVLSAFSLSSGLVGGVFAPSLFFGAVAGTAYHQILANFVHFVTRVVEDWGGKESALALATSSFYTLNDAPAYAVVGAAATLGALFRAPLTASMLMFEITQNHDIVLPVLASAGLAGLFAEILIHPRTQW